MPYFIKNDIKNELYNFIINIAKEMLKWYTIKHEDKNIEGNNNGRNRTSQYI